MATGNTWPRWWPDIMPSNAMWYIDWPRHWLRPSPPWLICSCRAIHARRNNPNCLMLKMWSSKTDGVWRQWWSEERRRWSWQGKGEEIKMTRQGTPLYSNAKLREINEGVKQWLNTQLRKSDIRTKSFPQAIFSIKPTLKSVCLKYHY